MGDRSSTKSVQYSGKVDVCRIPRRKNVFGLDDYVSHSPKVDKFHEKNKPSNYGPTNMDEWSFWATLCPNAIVTPKDYIVKLLDNYGPVCIACSFVNVRKKTLGRVKKRTYWLELHTSCLVLRKTKEKCDGNSIVCETRKIIPMGGLEIKLRDGDDRIIELMHEISMNKARKTKVLLFDSRKDMYLWWWLIQLVTTLPRRNPCNRFLKPYDPDKSNKKIGQIYLCNEYGKDCCKNSNSYQSKLILIRYSETENTKFQVGDADRGLTKIGYKQAELTAKYVTEEFKLLESSSQITIIYGGLRRTVETARIFMETIPWTKKPKQRVCCLLEDAAPAFIDSSNRLQYRSSMHSLAFEYLSRPSSSDLLEEVKIVICPESYIQYCISEIHNVPIDVVKLGAPLGNCSLTQIEVSQSSKFTIPVTNRVSHLPLAYQTI